MDNRDWSTFQRVNDTLDLPLKEEMFTWLKALPKEDLDNMVLLSEM